MFVDVLELMLLSLWKIKVLWAHLTIAVDKYISKVKLLLRCYKRGFGEKVFKAAVLVLAGAGLILFTVADVWPCFGFVLGALWITQGYFGSD